MLSLATSAPALNTTPETRTVSKATKGFVFANSLAARSTLQLLQQPPIIITSAEEPFFFLSFDRRTQFALSERVSRSEREAIPPWR